MDDQTVEVPGGFDRRTLVRWRNAIIAAFGVGGIALATWGPRLPALKADLRLGTGDLGVLLAGVTVGSVAGLHASIGILAALRHRDTPCRAPSSWSRWP